MNKILVMSAILTAAIFASGVLATIPAEVTVSAGSCGFSESGTLPFTAVTDSASGEVTGPLSVTVTNTGTYPTSGFKVSGINWWGYYSGLPNSIQTHVIDDGTNCPGSGTTGGCALPTIPGTIFGGTIGLGATVTPWFYVTIPSGTSADTYEQTITFTGGC